MGTNDTNATRQQRRPADVAPLTETPDPANPAPADRESFAPAAVQPAGERDESERPVVDPVTGAPL